jgi:hypothetical protein
MLALGMAFAWMLFPLPAWSVKVFLWHFVPPSRLSWGAGLILTLALAVIASRVPWKLSAERIVVFCTAVAFAWILSKLIFVEYLYPRPDLRGGTALARGWMDWIAVVPFMLLLFITRLVANDRIAAVLQGHGVLFGLIAAVGAMTFGAFNPLQSARPIFSPPETSYLRTLREMTLAHPEKLVALEQTSGAMLNGLGVPAINHILMRPQFDFFRARFPELADDVFTHVFNRYAQIIPSIESNIQILQPDAIQVPIDPFGLRIPVKTEQSDPVPVMKSSMVGRIEASSIKRVAPQKWQVVLRGWGVLDGFSTEQRLHIRVNQLDEPEAAVLSAVAFRIPRPDVASYFAREGFSLAGFALRLELEVGSDAQEAPRQTIRMWSDDPKLGSHEIVWK